MEFLVLQLHVGYRCSNSACRQLTSGPQDDPTKAVNLGVAAHITAASPDGPRYDPALPADDRRSTENGIWLCQTCSKLIDNDPQRYVVDVLRRWKSISEAAALRSLETRLSSSDGDDELLFLRLEQLMPDLLDEMRRDATRAPGTENAADGVLARHRGVGGGQCGGRLRLRSLATSVPRSPS